MQRRTKWGCAVVLGLGLLALAVPVALVGSAFVGIEPLVDGREYADGRVITVVDGYTSCLLVDVGEGRFVLIDGCMDPSASAIRNALEARGATLDDVEMMLLTHGHSDHIGVVAAAPNLPVRAFADEEPMLKGLQRYRGPLPGLMGRVDTGIRVTQPLVDGEAFDVGNTRFEAFAVPGHTAGSGVFLVHDVLVVGDSASGTSSGHIAPAPWVFTDDAHENVRSVHALGQRLSDRGIRWVVPAHTGPVAHGSLTDFVP